MAKIRILLADDHAVLRAGLRLLLDAQDDMEVCGEAESGQAAVAAVSRLKPDIVIMDLRMSGLDGIDTTRLLMSAPEPPRVLVLSMYEDPEFMDQALAAGAAGYALKRNADTELLVAIRALARGESYLAPSLTTVVLKRLRGEETAQGQEPSRADLSAREADVLKLLALGYTNRQIGEALGLSVKTVETYKARLLEKLGVYGRVGLVRYALAQGLLSENAPEIPRDRPGT